VFDDAEGLVALSQVFTAEGYDLGDGSGPESQTGFKGDVSKAHTKSIHDHPELIVPSLRHHQPK